MCKTGIWSITITGSLLVSSAYGVSYGFSDYYFVDPNTHWHMEGRYRHIGAAEFEKHKYGHINYADANTGIFYNHSFDEDNAISYEVEYDYLKVDWAKNPRFRETVFNYFGGSVGFISTEIEKWRWVMNAGFSVDADGFNFGKTGVYHGMLWGRYNFADGAGVNVGVMGWYGILNGYVMPIFGFDWFWGKHTKFNLIFPLNASITYSFNPHWSLEALYSGFGGPYKYPRRASEGIGDYHNPIFKLYSSGADLNLNYAYNNTIRASVGGGWNFGGWMLIKNHTNHHGSYYKYNSAPYAQGSLAFSF
ncbi:MAG: hypothetical protein LVR00_01815 [Rhabdochlamydiaceae bacterium]